MEPGVGVKEHSIIITTTTTTNNNKFINAIIIIIIIISLLLLLLSSMIGVNEPRGPSVFISRVRRSSRNISAWS